MVGLAAPSRTMNLALNRKRSRIDFELEDADEDEDEQRPAPTAPSEPSPDGLKRTKTENELDALDIIPAGDAWTVDVTSILASPTIGRNPASPVQAHNNAANYKEKTSIVVFCVQANMELHYNLLCAALPELYAIAPALQALVLCCEPSTHVPSTVASFSLPLVQAIGPGYNHFVRLGLLHPLGGGQIPLDALVVVDTKGRRRMVLPFGWGAGRHADTAGGKIVQSQLMLMLRRCVEIISRER
ncbi:hypothetical protein P154DRAFT_622031 [Amniculicola lignicola CBS 123094]|uniref:Uncharacterized protein n=1 Tax=Amniculicola lignicola CBS 123094 TaxID=1392246 RepID=A0A6A5WD33_9PLEO|nr:hypothetical protein P154DRAFT_622031 [Amniculicola lignicola CBS 123094]